MKLRRRTDRAEQTLGIEYASKMKTAWSQFILRTNHDLLGGGLDLIGHELPSSIMDLDKNKCE